MLTGHTTIASHITTHPGSDYQTDDTMTWQQENKTYQILKAAEEGKYGVVAAIA